MTDRDQAGDLRAMQRGGRWSLVGDGPAGVELVNDYLGYVADRGYSPKTERAYAFDLLAFARWLVGEQLAVDGVTTDALLRFLTFCRVALLPGQAGGNVVPLRTERATEYAVRCGLRLNPFQIRPIVDLDSPLRSAIFFRDQ